jgi:short-subunit dehydrogenase
MGALRTTRAALPHLLSSRGHLLLIGSLSAIFPAPGLAAYSASKAAVEALARSLRGELAHRGVTVGIAHYAFLRTPLVTEAEDNRAYAELRQEVPWPASRTYPLEPAVEATVKGIESRARVIAYPRWVRAAMVLRGLLDSPLAERAARGVGRDLEEGFRAEAARAGIEAASRGARERARL